MKNFTASTAASTNWNEPLISGDIKQPELTSTAIRDHLLKMIACHPNRNVRELTESFLNFELSEMADELIEFSEISPEFTSAILELRISDAMHCVYALQWKGVREYEANDIIKRATILEQFLAVQDAAASTRDEICRTRKETPSRKSGDLSLVGKFAMKCATVAESIELGRAVHWFEPPSWTLVVRKKPGEFHGSERLFLQILQLFRAIVVRDHAQVTLRVPAGYSPDWVTAQSDLPKEGARPAKDVVSQLEARARADRFGDDSWREHGLVEHFRSAA